MNHYPQQQRTTTALVPMNEQALAKMNKTGKQISAIIDECLPAATGNAADFISSLAIAKGVHDLKAIFLQSPEIRQVVMSMCNNRLGFLTDRTPAIVTRNQRNGKYPNKLYSYEELVDPIIEGLLKGYRISNNEINIISGQFYAAKAGNYRMILEYPGLANFAYNNSPAVYAQDHKSARVKCWASWKINEVAQSIGMEPNDELILAIRVNYGMGDDAVLGKAHAKLFKRVLERLSGQVIPESSDVEVINGQALPAEEIPAAPAQVAQPERPALDLYGEVEPAPAAKPTEVEINPQLRQKFAQVLRKELGGEDIYVKAALEDVPAGASRQGLSEAEFILKMLNFKQERDAWIEGLAGAILANNASKQVEVEIESEVEQQLTFPAPSEPQPAPQENNYWADRSNWVTRRGVPFLLLVRIGLALPFASGTLAKQDGDVVEITETAKATYNAERNKNPSAWGALLTAHAAVKVAVKNKIEDKGSMGLVSGIFDQWLAEASGDSDASGQPPEKGQDAPQTKEAVEQF